MGETIRAFQPVFKHGPFTLHAVEAPAHWPRTRPVLAVAVGPASPACVWTPLLEYVGDRLTPVLVDDDSAKAVPELGRSTWADARRDAAREVAGCLLGAAPAVVNAAWSLGVTTSLALGEALDPTRALHVWVSPVAWPPIAVSKLKSVFDAALRAQSEPWLARVSAVLGAETFPRSLVDTVRGVGASLDAGAWAKRLGLVHRALDTRRFGELASALSDVPRTSWLPLLEEAFAVRPLERAVALGIPTLVLSGDRDPVGLKQVRKFWGASTQLETMLVRGGGHMLPLEFPELIQLRVEKFLRDRGIIALSSSPRSSTIGGFTA